MGYWSGTDAEWRRYWLSALWQYRKRPSGFRGRSPSHVRDLLGKVAGHDSRTRSDQLRGPARCPIGMQGLDRSAEATPVVVSNGPTIALAATDGATCSDPTQI